MLECYFWRLNIDRVTKLRKIFKIVLFDRLRGLHSSLDLALFLDPHDESSKFLLARIQVHLGVDLEEVWNFPFHFFISNT